jgi:hypothetical protein
MLKIKPKNKLLDSYHMPLDELKYITELIQRKTRKTVVIENMTVIDYEHRYTNTQYIIEILTDEGNFIAFIDEIFDVDGNVTSITVNRREETLI